jgi:hypothetical protein
VSINGVEFSSSDVAVAVRTSVCRNFSYFKSNFTPLLCPFVLTAL